MDNSGSKEVLKAGIGLLPYLVSCSAMAHSPLHTFVTPSLADKKFRLGPNGSFGMVCWVPSLFRRASRTSVTHQTT